MRQGKTKGERQKMDKDADRWPCLVHSLLPSANWYVLVGRQEEGKRHLRIGGPSLSFLSVYDVRNVVVELKLN